MCVLRYAEWRPLKHPCTKRERETVNSPKYYTYGSVDRYKCANVLDTLAAPVMCIVGTFFHLRTPDISKRLQFFICLLQINIHVVGRR